MPHPISPTYRKKKKKQESAKKQSFCIGYLLDAFGWLLGKNQYTFNVESGSIMTEVKRWVEFFFGVKVKAMNNHRLPGK